LLRVSFVSLMLAAAVAHADRIEPSAPATCKVARGSISVTLRPDATVQELVTWFTSHSCKNVVFDSQVDRAATVTVVAPKKLTLRQAQQLFVDSVEAIGLLVQVKPDTIVLRVDPTTVNPCTTVASAEANVADPSKLTDDERRAHVAKLLDKGVRKINDTTYEVTRALANQVIAHTTLFDTGVRMVPAVKDGKPAGWKLYALRPDSLFARLGLANGDTLQAINGITMDSEAGTLEAFTKAKSARELLVSVIRRDAPVTINIKFVK
jgi:hypothetical protein